MKNDYDAPEGESFDEIYQSDGLRWASVVVVLLVVFGFFSLAWYAWRTNTRQTVEEGELIVVEADATPYKELPVDPGGMRFPHQDREVYNKLVTGEEEAKTVERLLPPPEEPMTERRITAQRGEPTASWINKRLHPEDGSADMLQDGGSDTLEVVESPLEKSDVKEEVKTQGEAPAYVPPKPVVKPWLPKEPPPAQPQMAKPEPAADPIVAQAEKFAEEKKAPVVEVVKKETPAVIPSSPAAGGVEVQLAALRSRAEAETVWQRLLVKHGDVLAGKPHSIVTAEIAGKGTYYRLRVSAGSALAAKSLCATLAGRNQACMVTR